MDYKTINGRVKFKRNTTAFWNEQRGFVPLDGEAIIYTDHRNIGTEQEPVWVPGLKIGDGDAYVQDLPFIDDALSQQLIAHINDYDLHITPSERAFWNNKLNVNDNAEVVGNTLVLNRN